MYCVIVGDIVNSRQLDAAVREKATRAANEIFDRINTEFASSLMAPFGMVRGDAFEGVLLTQHHAPKIVQDIIKALFRVDRTMVRISVALGHLTVTGSDRNITDGPAFHDALESLSRMKESGSLHWLQISFKVGPLAQALVDSNIALLTALTESWTDKQREAVWTAEMYKGGKKLISKNLGIQSSVVTKQLEAARFTVYHQAWEGLTDFLANMDDYTGDKAIVEKSYVPYYNIALREIQLSNYELAVQLLRKSLELGKQDLGEDNPLLIPIYNELSEVYIFIGQYDDAESAVQEAERIQADMPKMRLDYVGTLVSKALVCLRKHDLIQCEKCYLAALEIANNILSANHPVIGNINNRIALYFMGIEEYQKALHHHEQALNNSSMYKDKYPIDHADTLHNMAHCYKFLSEYNNALICEEEALKIYLENLPPTHKRVTDAKKLLAEIKSILWEKKNDR